MEELLDLTSHKLDPEVEAVAVVAVEAEASAAAEAAIEASVIEAAEVEAEASVIEVAEAVASVVAVEEAEVDLLQEVKYNSKVRDKCSELDTALLGECYNNLTPCFFGWLFGWLFVLVGPYGTARKNVPNVPMRNCMKLNLNT